MINAGTITAWLTLDTNRFNAGMESANSQLKAWKDDNLSIGEKIKGVGGALTTIGGTLTRNVTLPLVGAGVAAIKVAADFDEGMSKVAAISGATGEDLEKLRDKAREMGSKTKFSASEAADAMSYMAMAGWKTGDMLDGIEGIMNLAAASGEDLATTSDIVTDALTAFGLKAKDSAHFSDILAAASSNANTNVSMMGESFKYCAPIAGAMGYSAEDVAEALGLMANSGIKASQAGTAMRSIMTKLNGDIKISGKELGEVTIKTTNADGSMRELSDILVDCRGAFSKLTESEKSANAETLAGKHAMSGFLALMNAAPEDVDKLSGAISNCDGAAGKMAATMQNNLKGQLTVLKSQAEELAIGFGTELMPVAQDLVGVASSAVQAFSGLDDGTKKFIVYAGLAAAATGPLVSVIGSVTSGVGSMITTLGGAATAFSAAGGGAAGLGAAITSIIGPAGWVVLAIGAVTAAGIALYAATRDANKGTRELGEAFKGAAEGAKSFYDEVQNGGSVNLTSSFSSELNSGINMNDLQQKISNTQQKITDAYDKAIKKRGKLTKKDIKELKKYYDDLKKLHEEQSKYYANNLTALVQAVNDGLELNEESAQEILKQGKANMDAALKAEEQAHNDRITAIEKIYKDDEAARNKAIDQENKDYAKHKEEIKPMGAPTPLADARKSGEDTAEAYNSGIDSKKPDAKKSGEDIADSAVKPMGAPTPLAEAQKNGQGLVTSMNAGLNSKKPEAVKAADGIMTSMHTAMSSVSFTGIGGNIVSGILRGINDKAPSLMNRARSLATGITGVIGGALRINSPSKVMIPMGEAVAEGMEVGLMQGAGSLYETASAISLETAETLGSISTRGMNLSGVHSTNYGDRLDRLLDAVEKLADSQTTMEIDGRPFGRLVREYV